jgi:hypothetical protein
MVYTSSTHAAGADFVTFRNNSPATRSRRLAEDLKRIIPDKHHRERFLHLIEQLDADVAVVTLPKGPPRTRRKNNGCDQEICVSSRSD